MKDKDIREPLFDYLDEKYGKNRVFEEKIIGFSRADIIMIIENEFIGLEIKSDADTYVRLESQISDYDDYCDRNYVVVGKSHAKHVEEHIPPYWGIICVYEDEESASAKVSELKAAAISPKATLKNQIKLLWRPEIAKIQAMNNLYKYDGKSKKFVQDYLLESIDEKELKAMIIEQLFERDYEETAKAIIEFRARKSQKKRRRVSAKKAAKKARKAML